MNTNAFTYWQHAEIFFQMHGWFGICSGTTTISIWTHSDIFTTQIYHGSWLPSVIDALNLQRVTKKFTRLSILTQRSFLDLWSCHCVTNLMTIKPENKCSHFAAFRTTVWWREKWAQRLNGHIVRFQGIIVELSYRLFILWIYNHGIFGISWNVENMCPLSIFFLLFFYSLKQNCVSPSP